MEIVTVSSKYQVVIPRSIRETLGIKPGQKIRALLYDGRLEFIPVKPIETMRGFLKGLDTVVDRDPDRV